MQACSRSKRSADTSISLALITSVALELVTMSFIKEGV